MRGKFTFDLMEESFTVLKYSVNMNLNLSHTLNGEIWFQNMVSKINILGQVHVVCMLLTVPTGVTYWSNWTHGNGNI